MPEKEVQYKSYLLRLWREGATADTPWRATVERVAEERELHHFADIERLIHFLLVESGKSSAVMTDQDLL